MKTGIRDRQGKTLHNDQGINPRRHNNYKSICSQHRSTSIHRQMLTVIKGEINSNTILVGDFILFYLLFFSGGL